MGIGGCLYLETDPGVLTIIFEKNFFSVPRPAGVNFFSINIVPEGTPKKIIGRFIGRQNPAFDLCIGKTI